MRQILIQRRASKEWQNILRFIYFRFSPQTAHDTDYELFIKLRQLAAKPGHGKKGRVRGKTIYWVLFKRYTSIFYSFTDTTLTVHSLFDNRRNPGKRLF